MKKIIYFTLIICTIGFIFSCQKEESIIPYIQNTGVNYPLDSTTNTNTNTSKKTLFNIRMTDAPLNVEEVNVDLQLVVIKGSNTADSIQLGTNAGIYNLLDFQNGIDTLIASATITLDTVKQVRLILGEENTIKVDGVIHDLKTPSAQQSGLKVKVDLPLDSLNVYNLLLDFDAEESVKENGNGYMLKPVIKIL